MIEAPYPGLRPFSRDEAGIFFGREDQVDQLLDKLEETHFLAVLGTSGSGKSSLVRAGLLPALDSGFMTGAGVRWAIVELRPGDRPFQRLGASLIQDTEWGRSLCLSPGDSKAFGDRESAARGIGIEEDPGPVDQTDATCDQAVAELEQDLRRGNLALNWRLGVSPLPAGVRLLILVDQFEELFRYHRRAASEAVAFVSLLLGAASHPDVYIVITLRSEFLGDCALYPELPEAINAGLFLVPRPGPEQIADAIQLPARLFGGDVEPDLARGLLQEVRGETDQLPLLQHALMRLWDLDPSHGQLTREALDGLGGPRRALEDHAEEAFAELDPEQQRIAEVLFRSLTERGPEERDTRRPVPLGEVAELAGVDAAQVTAVVEVFRQPGRSFLMPPTGTPLEMDRVLDITHEAFIRQWRRLRDWTADEADRAEVYQRLAAAAERWEEGKGALWIDPDLEYALRWREQTRPNALWAARYGGDLALALRFLDEARDTRERYLREQEIQRSRALRRAQWTAAIAVVGLAIVAGAAGWAWIERRNAVVAEQRLTRHMFDSSIVDAAWLASAENYTKVQMVLATTSDREQEVPPAQRLARDLLTRYSEILGGGPDKTYVGAGSPLFDVDLSPDGRLLAACGERGTLVLFDAESGELIHRLKGHDPNENVNDLAFDPGGRWLASAGNDRGIILWSLPAKGKPAVNLRQWLAPDRVRAMALSPDGALLATGGDDDDISLWDPRTGTRIRTLVGHWQRISEVTGLAFSPNGKRLASASYDGTAILWDVTTGARLTRLKAQTKIKSVAFSADGKYLAAGSDDNRVVLWDVGSGEAVRVYTGPRNMIYGLSFAARAGEPNAAPLLIAAGFDRSLRVWDSESAVTLRVLQGHTAAVNGIHLHGTQLYSAGSDGTVRRWDLSLPNQRLLDLSGEPASAAIAPDGDAVAVGFANGSLRLYALPELTLLWQDDHAHDGDVQRLAFSSDGSMLASAGFDNLVRLWRLEPKGKLDLVHTLKGHTKPVHAVAFSPDGRNLATAGYDGRVGLFDAITGRGKLFEAAHGQLLSVAFNPTGKRIFVADRNHRLVQVWDFTSDPPVLSRELPASRGLLLWAEPDARGTQIAAVGRDYVVSVLAAANGELLHRLSGHENAVFKARFLPGGRQLATVGVDATVRLWDLDTDSELFTLRLPTNQGEPTPLWDFDLRCTPTGCWLAVPLTRGKLALYDLGTPQLPPAPEIGDLESGS